MRNGGYCADAVERAHTKSLDANDKLIKTRSHVRDTTASRKRQVIMRKGKSTMLEQKTFSGGVLTDTAMILALFLLRNFAIFIC